MQQVLVDLAGSERLKKTNTSGDLKAETMYINQSLSYLEQVASQPNPALTPTRQ